MKREHPLKSCYDIIDGGGDIYIPHFPRIIEFEITNHCNFQCLMCKTGVGTALRERGYMSSEIFEKVLEEVNGKGTALKFVGQGEPLLHADFIHFIKRAVENNIVCHLTTNGSVLDRKYMEDLIASGIHSIKFSFQGVEAEGYRILRQKDDFEALLEKIQLLYELRGDRKYPFITICTTITNETKEQTDSFRKRCEKISDKVEIGITTLEFIELDKIKGDETRIQLERLKQEQIKQKKRFRRCHQVFDVITVRWNGDVTACCADNDGVMTLGNLDKMSITQCWNCDKENRYRNILKENRYEELPLCKDCYDVMGYTGDKRKE